MKQTKTTIAVTIDLREELEKLKVHPREPVGDVIKRLLERSENEKERNI